MDEFRKHLMLPYRYSQITEVWPEVLRFVCSVMLNQRNEREGTRKHQGTVKIILEYQNIIFNLDQVDRSTGSFKNTHEIEKCKLRLGLAVVSKSGESHIWQVCKYEVSQLDSEEKRDTTFHLWVPLSIKNFAFPHACLFLTAPTQISSAALPMPKSQWHFFCTVVTNSYRSGGQVGAAKPSQF